MTALTHLDCSGCGARHDADTLQTVCRSCGRTLLARYDLDRVRREIDRDLLTHGEPNLWRFAPLLPVSAGHRLTLGEGLTPLLAPRRLRDDIGLSGLLVKDEGRNPTGTFKARGLCVAVSRAVELGARAFAVPTAGNAGVALAAYAAAAGLPAVVFAPADTPPRILRSIRDLGADLRLVDGLISDAGKACAAHVAAHPGTLDVSTLQEPYRAEGKKTMGLEVAADLGWRLPDAIVYPTGGGTGIVGMAKAFEELRKLGWVEGAPRLYSVQAEGCAPVVRALEHKAETAEFWEGAATSAAGLRVPKPFADRLVLRALRESRGGAVAVPEKEIHRGTADLARDGILACPEGGAALAGLRRLVAAGEVRAAERVVLFNTGSGLTV